MKKYIAITFVALAALTGCKDFLVEDPILSQSNELTLATFDGLDKATLGAYSPLASSSAMNSRHLTVRSGSALLSTQVAATISITLYTMITILQEYGVMHTM